LHAPQRWSASFVMMPLRHLDMTSLRLRTSAAIVYAVAPPWQEPGWKANIGPLRRVASFDALFRPEHFANLEPEKISALQQLKEVSTLLRRSHLWSHCASYVAFVWRRISPSVALLAMLAVCWRHAARVLPASVWSVLVFTTAGCGVM
jgi:hypothetical protein